MFEFLKKTLGNFASKVKESLGKKIEVKSEKLEDKSLVSSEALVDVQVEPNKVEFEGQVSKGVLQESETKAEVVKEESKNVSASDVGLLEKKSVDKRELKAKANVVERIKGAIIGKIKISEKDTQQFFDELELSLLEADVEQETAAAIVCQLKEQLVGKEISARQDLSVFLKDEIKKAIVKIMDSKKINILEINQKPVKILFLGPNGAGKTTSIAKVASMLKDKGKSSIIAASDTFRAASIEQLEEHGKMLGVKVVKQKYGSDPAAVAYDAVKAAEAKHIDFVLVDTAGRQETNRNLVEELKKIDRVIKPDLKIYVGEAYTGQALISQVREFDNAVGVDAVILTKIDADAKGGTAISLLYNLKKPIIYVGTGQKYSDLVEFNADFVVNRIL